ncbi:MAG: hypothetical protein A3D35_01015 [Candidatus Staskawiczbacteria bacterium RIFCSPHIGHO2_02_FULL_34_9]|uniref:Uncharacterized protein n=1 Tax=Candidatus Staskawiczbacteria bacterium RIFCSPHIGHO2_02_FULL_34_9 TaxID=1802206 RepID=A0A1G2HXU4_9BACT|nr:MAG: hypothetical protein A3D35_01015 [Candidatus Staskawiczbacteria bacterium RIFCSPHIGHO2_02_FULL_34_9]
MIQFNKKSFSLFTLVFILVLLAYGIGYYTRSLRVDNSIVQDQIQRPVFFWETYKNNEYGFQITLTDVWKGYKVLTDQDDNWGAHSLSFEVLTKDTSYPSYSSGYATVFTIVAFPHELWTKLQKEEGPHGAYITENNDFVFAYYQWQAAPDDLWNVNFNVPEIISTFKFIQ